MQTKGTSDIKLRILVLQTVAVGLIILFAVILRLFGGDIYRSVSRWYHSRFDEITTADEVLKPQNNTSSDENTTSSVVAESESAKDNLHEEYDSEIDGDVSGNLTDFDDVQQSVGVSSVNTFQWPLIGTITSRYGYRKSPFTGENSMHNGLDIAKEQGSGIISAYDGTVSAAGYSSSYGYYIKIDHGNSVETLYAHCSKLLVEKGEAVRKGEKIALVGSTGRSTGPHLHFEVRVGGYRLDPEWLLSDLQEV